MDAPLTRRPLSEVLDAVAARTPAPGGGSVSAWVGALAAGLVEMSAAFDPDAGMGEIAAQARQARTRLVELAEAELTAFEPVLEALRLPEDDPSREERRRTAASAAAETPLAIARLTAEVAALAAEAAAGGSRHLLGDALAGAELAGACCRAAARLVEINLADVHGDPRIAEVGELARRSREALD